MCVALPERIHRVRVLTCFVRLYLCPAARLANGAVRSSVMFVVCGHAWRVLTDDGQQDERVVARHLLAHVGAHA